MCGGGGGVKEKGGMTHSHQQNVETPNWSGGGRFGKGMGLIRSKRTSPSGVQEQEKKTPKNLTRTIPYNLCDRPGLKVDKEVKNPRQASSLRRDKNFSGQGPDHKRRCS